MIRQRFVAFLMIALEAAAAQYMLLQFEWFPVVLVVIAAVGATGLARVKLGDRGILVMALALTILVSYATESSLLFAHRLPVLPFLTGYLYPIGWCLLAVQVAILFIGAQDDRLPVYFPAIGAAVLAYAGQRHESNDLLYHGAAMTFVVLMVLFWSSGRRHGPTPTPRSTRLRGTLIQGSLLMVALPLSFATSTLIGANRVAIDTTFMNLVGAVAPVSKVGFSTQARLDSVKRLQVENGEKVALRVYASDSPGYMRGRAYDTYDRGQWSVMAKEKTLPRAPEGAVAIAANTGGTLFEVGRGHAPYASLTVAPAMTFEGCLFAPLNTVAIGLQETSPAGDTNGNLRTGDFPTGSDYQVITAAPLEQMLSEDAQRAFTALPAEMDAGVRYLAARLFKNCATVQEKTNAVVRYFAENYTYQLGIEVPAGKDPVTYFLLEQPPAHCEYFATGAALLLRLGDVPCRYVTGFVTDELNPFGRYWVARNKNAHAWVEVYDDERKTWVTVEPTVAAGVPTSGSNERAGFMTQLRDFAGYVVQSLRTAIATGKWGNLRPLLKSLRWELAALGLVIGAATLTRILRRRYRTSRAKARAALSPTEKELLRLRKRIDREMRRRGLVRRPNETINAFADRIAGMAASQMKPAMARKLLNAATWYGKYNEVRFRGPLSPDTITELRRNAHS